MSDLCSVGTIGPFTIIGYKDRRNRCLGLVDKNGTVMISPDRGFDGFIDYHDGLIIANKPTKTGPGWMVIDYLGNPITSEGYGFITYAGEGCYDVEKGSRHNIMRRDGTFVLGEWSHRVSDVHDGYFTYGKTIRKTKTTPTRYIEGLAHVNGTIVFPMVFDSLIHTDGRVFSAKFNGEVYVVRDGAVFDPAKRHYPSLDPWSGLKDVCERVINWILPGLQFFYRDTDAEIDIDTQYPIGKVLRSGFFVDMSTMLLRPATRTRFIIAAAHAAAICDYDNEEDKKIALDYSPKVEEWRHAVLHKNTWLKVMDVYKRDDVTQVLLLQIPETVAKSLADEPSLFEFVDQAMGEEMSIVDMARQSLDEKSRDIVHPRSLDSELVELMSRPIGYMPDGKPYSIEPDLTPYEHGTNLSDGTPGLGYSRYIHGLADDRDIVREFGGFPWRGVVGTMCEGCMYAKGTNGRPFGCGRLFEKTFRANYLKGSCDYFKTNVWSDSLIEYRRRRESEKQQKKAGIYAEKLVREFISDKLHGEIEELATFDLSSLRGDQKYGTLKCPDMIANFAIVKSIIEIAFGEHWPDLNVDSLDTYTYQTGTIINDQRLVGPRIADRLFKSLTDEALVDMAEELHSLKSMIGNFMVWPNKAMICNFHDSAKMRGYIDRLFIAMYDVVANVGKQDLDLKGILYKNRKLMAEYQGVEGFQRFMRVSLLEDFLDETGVPVRYFDGISQASSDFNQSLLPAAIKQYRDFMVPFIHKRTRRIIDILRERGF